MRVKAIDIRNFRGVQCARVILPDHGALVGPNGAGKSTLVDALSLAFGRNRLVRDLTEHDFFGSAPGRDMRIMIVVTLGGFSSNDPNDHPAWIRTGRGVAKWWRSGGLVPEPVSEDDELCVQVGFAARFDFDDLEVHQIRYFHDDEDTEDPFDEAAVKRFPRTLLNEVGFFVLPTRRTWASTISFGSELFRKAVTTLGGVPADAVRNQLARLRDPANPMEVDPAIRGLIDRLSDRMCQLVPGQPRLQLRLTATDSESLLKALVPHFQGDEGPSLPAGRHGTGLVSLQTLALLLEIGRARKEEGKSFILALEEPELHVPPGLQRRLLGEAVSVADQTICTTHAPRVLQPCSTHGTSYCLVSAGSSSRPRKTTATPLRYRC